MLKYTHYHNDTKTKCSHKKLTFSIDIHMLTLCLCSELDLTHTSTLEKFDLNILKLIKAKEVEKDISRILINSGMSFFDYVEYPPEDVFNLVKDHVKSLFPQLV